MELMMIKWIKDKLNKAWKWIKDKAKIIAVILGGGILVASNVVGNPIFSGGMTKVNIIGEKAEYYFDCGGVFTIEPATAEDYNSRFERFEKPNPSKNNCVYKGGRRFYAFDSFNEELNDGQYATNIEFNEERYYIQIKDRFLNLSTDEVASIKTIQ